MMIFADVTSALDDVNQRWRAGVEAWHKDIQRLFDDRAARVSQAIANDLLALLSDETGAHVEEARAAAARRLALRLPPGLADRRAAHELRQLAKLSQKPPRLLLRQEILPSAMLIANTSRNAPQHVRLGARWLKDPRGRKRHVVPEEDLTTPTFMRWLSQKTMATAAADLCGGIDASSTTRAPEHAPSDAPVGHPAREEQLQHLNASLPPRERELIAHLVSGVSRHKLPTVMGAAPSTVRTWIHRIKLKCAS